MWSQESNGPLPGHREPPPPPQPYTQGPEAAGSPLPAGQPAPGPRQPTAQGPSPCRSLSPQLRPSESRPHPAPRFLPQEAGPSRLSLCCPGAVPATFLALRGPEHGQVEVVLGAGSLVAQALGLGHAELALRHGATPAPRTRSPAPRCCALCSAAAAGARHRAQDAGRTGHRTQDALPQQPAGSAPGRDGVATPCRLHSPAPRPRPSSPTPPSPPPRGNVPEKRADGPSPRHTLTDRNRKPRVSSPTRPPPQPWGKPGA